MDINSLHNVNSEGGYEAGDKLIVEAALDLKKCLSVKSDYVYRLHGDEFAVLLKTKGNMRSSDLHCPSNLYTIAAKCSNDFDTKSELFTAVNKLLLKRKKEFYSKTNYERRTYEQN
jgi:GGDEF domain-containing protein